MNGQAAGFDYKALVLEALVKLVRRLIERVAAEGFPGDHHFLLTFGTDHPGVVMSPRLRRRFPEEMTIVLQHQFWNLRTNDDSFEVTLRFGGNPEPLTVPWASLRAFADPSTGFGLRLQDASDAGAEPEAAIQTEDPAPAAAHGGEPAVQEPAEEAASKVLAFSPRRRRSSDKS